MNSNLGEQRPVRQLDALFAYLPVDESAKTKLASQINADGRFYHGAAHLADLWGCHRRHAADAGLDTPRTHRRIACAVAYHDAVYDSRRSDNEERSARAWLDISGRCGLDEDEAEWVAETIRATRDHLAYDPSHGHDAANETLRLWFLDLDLSPLAEEPKRFRLNSRRLRQEAPHLSDVAWAAGNLAFMRKIASAPRIFRCSVLFDAYEDLARENITAAINRQGKA